MLAYLAGIPRRIGYDLDGVAPFLTERLRHQRLHAVEQSLRLAQAWTAAAASASIKLDYPLEAADSAYIERTLLDWDLTDNRPILCIHAGSGASSKHWENDKWASAADALAAQLQASIVLTGTNNEAALVTDIANKMREPAFALAGATSVGQVAALYRRSLLVLGVDSGAMHLAAAVGTPTVTLFGPADPLEFAPWGDQHRHAILTAAIGCRPCRILDWRDDNAEFHPCLRDISVCQVLEAASTVIESAQD
jgi:heptosyltransferase-2/heptosyltransferase-3